MGVLGRYIDGLPDAAKDRLVVAQEWCVGDVVGAAGERCLIGHAEDWRPVDSAEPWWRPEAWAEVRAEAGSVLDDETVFACSREFFSFRRMQPADFEVYRRRVRRWGLASESEIGSRFDRLFARRGPAEAVRLVKRRAAARAVPGVAPLRVRAPAARPADAAAR